MNIWHDIDKKRISKKDFIAVFEGLIMNTYHRFITIAKAGDVFKLLMNQIIFYQAVKYRSGKIQRIINLTGSAERKHFVIHSKFSP